MGFQENPSSNVYLFKNPITLKTDLKIENLKTELSKIDLQGLTLEIN